MCTYSLVIQMKTKTYKKYDVMSFLSIFQSTAFPFQHEAVHGMSCAHVLVLFLHNLHLSCILFPKV